MVVAEGEFEWEILFASDSPFPGILSTRCGPWERTPARMFRASATLNNASGAQKRVVIGPMTTTILSFGWDGTPIGSPGPKFVW